MAVAGLPTAHRRARMLRRCIADRWATPCASSESKLRFRFSSARQLRSGEAAEERTRNYRSVTRSGSAEASAAARSARGG